MNTKTISTEWVRIFRPIIEKGRLRSEGWEDDKPREYILADKAMEMVETLCGKLDDITAERDAARAARWRGLAIHLECFNHKAVVRIEVGKKWVDVIEDYIGAHVSHIVEPAGISAAIDAALAQRGERK